MTIRQENSKREVIPGGEKETDAWAVKDGLEGRLSKRQLRFVEKVQWLGNLSGARVGVLLKHPIPKIQKFVHEGGIASPFIAHWPKGLKSKNKIISHVLSFH